MMLNASFPQTSVEHDSQVLPTCGREFSQRIPLTLQYRGGSWRGSLLLDPDERTAGVRIEGMVHLVPGQKISLSSFPQSERHAAHPHELAIRQVSVRRGIRVYEGTTECVLEAQKSDACAWKGQNGQSGNSGSLLSGIVATVLEDFREHTGTAELHSGLVEPCSSEKKPSGKPDQNRIVREGYVRSVQVALTKENGHRISVYHDYPTDADAAEAPTVIVVPGYGETKRDYLMLAYYLAANGFHVLRYDHTNHVGESSGPHYDCSLSAMKEDYRVVAGFAKRHWPGRPVVGVASSVAARVVLKAEAEYASVDLLILLVPIVDVRASVRLVHQEDVFAAHETEICPESANILGLNVGKQFVHDACHNRFASLEETLQDAHRVTAPVMMVSAEKDSWVRNEDLQRIGTALGSRLRKWMVAAGALHRLQENPSVTRQVYREIVGFCRNWTRKESFPAWIQEPNRADMGRQNRKEKMKQLHRISGEMGEKFWQDYLSHFRSVGNCQDYLALLDHAIHALGPIKPGQRLLDVGCGNGNAGLFVYHRLQRELLQAGTVESLRYVGIDLVHDALKRAQENFTSIDRERTNCVCPGGPLIQSSWIQADLKSPLPFSDGQFDLLISNLVLGYVPDFFFALKELYRVLLPGGRMVISNLKPQGDFSEIYQRLVEQAPDEQALAQARSLLNNYGKIRQAEKEGRFHFYDQEQWRKMLKTLGWRDVQVYPAFANQALLIVIAKPAESRTAGLLQEHPCEEGLRKESAFYTLQDAA